MRITEVKAFTTMPPEASNNYIFVKVRRTRGSSDGRSPAQG